MSVAVDLGGRRALVTGGTRGIGFAIAERLVAAGAEVVVASRSQASCDEAAATLGDRATGIACDVADPDAVATLAERAGAIDRFVACAGLSSPGKAADLPLEELERMMRVHYVGAVQGARLAADKMHDGGAVLMVTSVWGLGGQPGTLAYGAAKAALAHTVKVLAIEWARRGIRVNGLAPGFIDTDMTSDLPDGVRDKLLSRVPMRRAGTPREMADAALFLLSDLASYVTGHVLVADGGERAR